MEETSRPLRVPIAQAAKRGVSWLNETATQRRVILTRFGRPGTVVDSAERLDEAARKTETARREVVAHFAETASQRTGRHSLEDVCAKLEIDPQRVRDRAAQLRG